MIVHYKLLHVLMHYTLFEVDNLTIIKSNFALALPLMLNFDPENMRIMGHALAWEL